MRKDVKKILKVSIFLIVLGEILYSLLNYSNVNNTSNFSEFTTGLLLGLSVGMKLVGVVLLFICIFKSIYNILIALIYSPPTGVFTMGIII